MSPTDSERPRDVFLAACAEIGRSLISDGFVARGKQELVRVRGPFDQDIRFESSHYNTTGHVVMRPFAHIESKEFGAWRTWDQSGVPSFVAGIGIGELNGRGWTEYELGDPTTRTEQTEAVIADIHKYLISWFDLVEDPDALSLTAKHSGTVAGVHGLHTLVDFLVFLSSQDAAAAAIEAWANSRPKYRPEDLAGVAPLIERHRLAPRLPTPRGPGLLSRLGDRLRSVAAANIDAPRNSK